MAIRHGKVLQEQLAGFDETTIGFPQYASQRLSCKLYNPFSEYYMRYLLSPQIYANVEDFLRTSGWLDQLLALHQSAKAADEIKSDKHQPQEAQDTISRHGPEAKAPVAPTKAEADRPLASPTSLETKAVGEVKRLGLGSPGTRSPTSMITSALSKLDFLTKFAAASDTLPVIYQGKYYRMLVGAPTSIVTHGLLRYNQRYHYDRDCDPRLAGTLVDRRETHNIMLNVIPVAYGGRINYLIDEPGRVFDLASWRKMQPEGILDDRLGKQMDAITQLLARCPGAFDPIWFVVQPQLTPLGQRVAGAPGPYLAMLPGMFAADAHGRYDVNHRHLALSPSIPRLSFVPDYQLPELTSSELPPRHIKILTKFATGPLANYDTGIELVITALSYAPLGSPRKDCSCFDPSQFTAQSGKLYRHWQITFVRASKFQQVRAAAVEIVRYCIDHGGYFAPKTTGSTGEPVSCQLHPRLQYLRCPRVRQFFFGQHERKRVDTGYNHYTSTMYFDDLPDAGARQPREQRALLSPLSQHWDYWGSPAAPTTVPGAGSIHTLHQNMVNIYKPIASRQVPSKLTKDIITINGVAMSTSELELAFRNTPLGVMAVESGDDDDNHDCKQITLDETKLIKEFLDGQIMLGVLASELSANGYHYLAGDGSLLYLYEHIASRLFINRHFMLGHSWQKQVASWAADMPKQLRAFIASDKKAAAKQDEKEAQSSSAMNQVDSLDQ